MAERKYRMRITMESGSISKEDADGLLKVVSNAAYKYLEEHDDVKIKYTGGMYSPKPKKKKKK